MDNLAIVLAGVGLGLEHAAQVRIYLTAFDRDYEAMNQTYKSYFAEGRLPARTCIGVTALAVGARVEIDLVAKRPSLARSGGLGSGLIKSTILRWLRS